MAEDDTTPSLALESCREGLKEAREQGRRRQDRFEEGEVTLTVKTEVRRDTEVSGGERWCDLQADATKKKEAGITQTLMLPMTRGLYDEDGNRSNHSPVSVHVNRPQPGR